MTTETKTPKGTLKHVCFATFSYAEVEVYKCEECDTPYTRETYRPLMINNVAVGTYHKEFDCVSGALCPWCREDSAPWTNGRGL